MGLKKSQPFAACTWKRDARNKDQTGKNTKKWWQRVINHIQQLHVESLGDTKRSHGGKFPKQHEPIAAFLDQLRDGVLEQDRSRAAENFAARCTFVNSGNYKYKLCLGNIVITYYYITGGAHPLRRVYVRRMLWHSILEANELKKGLTFPRAAWW